MKKQSKQKNYQILFDFLWCVILSVLKKDKTIWKNSILDVLNFYYLLKYLFIDILKYFYICCTRFYPSLLLALHESHLLTLPGWLPPHWATGTLAALEPAPAIHSVLWLTPLLLVTVLDLPHGVFWSEGWNNEQEEHQMQVTAEHGSGSHSTAAREIQMSRTQLPSPYSSSIHYIMYCLTSYYLCLASVKHLNWLISAVHYAWTPAFNISSLVHSVYAAYL